MYKIVLHIVNRIIHEEEERKTCVSCFFNTRHLSQSECGKTAKEKIYKDILNIMYFLMAIIMPTRLIKSHNIHLSIPNFEMALVNCQRDYLSSLVELSLSSLSQS